LAALCEELSAEIDRAIRSWREAAAGAASTAAASGEDKEYLQQSANSGAGVAAERPKGVRPQQFCGERWFCACLETPKGRVLGPLRPTAEAAGVDYERLVNARGSDTVAVDALASAEMGVAAGGGPFASDGAEVLPLPTGPPQDAAVAQGELAGGVASTPAKPLLRFRRRSRVVMEPDEPP